MKIFLLPIIAFLLSFAPVTQTKIYNPDANALTDLTAAIAKAKSEKKHVLVQIGGNWCPWCMKFYKLSLEDPKISQVVSANFVPIKINYSKENKNFEALARLGYPQRFGFPVFVILDGDGNRLHTQNSSYLEDNDNYSVEKVVDFFKQWSPAAVNPANYPSQK